MQVANALNNNIRILFNPKVEPFKLFDFLMVKSNDDRYLAQIIEIYDDKFDSSQNVAKLKLFYKITKDDEVMPYDNFTPNRECEIIKIKQDDVENFINQGKKTFIFGTNTKNSCSLNIQFDFFNNNAVILADKVDESNAISLNLAKKLSVNKHSIIIDSTGIIEFEEAQKIKASKNFRLPLNFSTIDFVFDKCLSDASLEFQQIAGSILLEIKRFAKRQALEFIPFNMFARVLLEQYKATPYPELKLLLVRLKKYQMDEIFAKTKKDVETLFKTIEKNPITIIDISSVSSMWQKAYLEYFINVIEQNVYLITRINDENCDVDLINKIYTEKRNIKFIPNVSYNYKKLPSLMQYCKNYILLPSLYQRTDFLNANFALANLITDECIIFGENTDDFLYLAKDYELEMQEKRKNYRKIALSMVNSENQSEQNDYESNENIEDKTDSQKLIDELTELQENQIKSIESSNFDEIIKDDETFEEIENPKKNADDFLSVEEDFLEKNDDFSVVEDAEKPEKSISQKDEFQALEEKNIEEIQQNFDENSYIEQDVVDVNSEDKNNEKDDVIVSEKENSDINKIDNNNTDNNESEILELDLSSLQKEHNDNKNIDDEDKNISFEEKDAILKEKFNMQEAELIDPDDIVEDVTSAQAQTQQDNLEEVSDMDFSDEELDFFQIAKESSMHYEQEEQKNNKVVVDDVEYKTKNDTQDNKKKDEINNSVLNQSDEQDDDIDLKKLANESLDESFSEIIDKKPKETKQNIALDDDVNIDIDVSAAPEKETLPIFKEEQNTPPSETYKIGDVIVHKKYGRGVIVKTIKYEERQLLQIEFDESGKKLLDPRVADIKLEQ